MIQAAVLFRGKVYKGDCHSDCLQDAIEDPIWPEPHWEIERLMDEQEPPEFGYWSPNGFSPLAGLEQRIRQDWYVREGAR